jgi:HNH endonuclease
MPKGEVNQQRAALWWAANGYDLRRLIEVEQVTQKEAARQLGTTRSIVEAACRRYGLHTQGTGPRRGDKHPDWKGGRKKVGRYWYVYVPHHPYATRQRYVAEHRKIVEDSLGRYLEPTEVVHHRDGNPENNDLSNLVVFVTNAEHLRHELTDRQPNWSEDGKRRIAAGVEKAAATHRRLAADVRRRFHTTDRQPS